MACVTHPIGAAIMALAGGPAAIIFAVFHGTGNGILTIARGTLPLADFGPKDYGYRLGILGAPARIAQAAAPLAFSVLVDHLGGGVLIVSSGLSILALAALSLVHRKSPEAAASRRLHRAVSVDVE
jgi:MFS family permease